MRRVVGRLAKGWPPSDCQLCGSILDTLCLKTGRSAARAERFLPASLAAMGQPSPPGTSEGEKFA